MEGNKMNRMEKLEQEYSRANHAYIAAMIAMKEAFALINCDNPSLGALRQARLALQAGIASAKELRGN
jgi:hypothetical protein